VSDVIIGVRSLTALQFGVEREHITPGLGSVAKLAKGHAGVREQEPGTWRVVSQYLSDAVAPASKQFDAETRLERLNRAAGLEPCRFACDWDTHYRCPGPHPRDFDRRRRLHKAVDPSLNSVSIKHSVTIA